MTYNQLSALLDKLINLRDTDASKRGTGICFYLSQNQNDYCKEIWRTWEHYSGMPKLPVPSPIKGTNVAYAYTSFNKWSKKSKYGQMRYKLLDYLIEQTELRLKDMS
jgi:hypothetical protein